MIILPSRKAKINAGHLHVCIFFLSSTAAVKLRKCRTEKNKDERETYTEGM